MVQYLLEHGGSNIQEADSTGYTALLYAADCGNLPVVQCLIEHDSASISDRDNKGRTALLCAAKFFGSGDAQLSEVIDHNLVMQWLLQHGSADILDTTAEGCTVWDILYLSKTSIMKLSYTSRL